MLIVFAGLLTLLPPQNVYSVRAETEVLSGFRELIIPSPAPLPLNTTNVFPPDVSAEGVLVIDIPSDTVLFAKNPDVKYLPASTTKIMTALVALEDYKLEDEVTINTVISEGQKMGLIKDEVMTVENLLYGTLVHSANDAAFTLAEHHEGGVEAFVGRMNQKAENLHLTKTHFTNPIGFDDPNHYTTPRDLATLATVALGNPTFTKIVGIPQITIADTTYTHFHSLRNVNELLGKIPGIYGIKTGWTENSGQSLVTVVTRNGRKVLMVILKSEDRFGETEALLNWVLTNFEWKEFTS